MCGIAGIHDPACTGADRDVLLRMAGELRHRGPDGTGLYLDGPLGMVNTRLAIVDLDTGDQPLSCDHGRFWAMQNGEIYNYVELRAELLALGRRFRTTSDTEVVANAYAEWGVGCLDRFNGDFAIAVWDRERRELLLARDRFGVRPLFLATLAGATCFASEIRALLRHPRASRALDPVGIADTFTLWGGLPDHTAFAGVRELAPAHYVIVGPDGAGPQTRWWDLCFEPSDAPAADLVDELDAALVDATRLRLRADVPVATYLSGGLDSSAVAAIAARQLGTETLFAFGVGFRDPHFDESGEQDAIGRALGTAFHRTTVDAAAIGAAFPRVVELAEKPLLRTAPAPLLALSRSVRDAGLKVVLTGEGADELFAGYDIFREDKVRRFWARDPASELRPRLFARLNRFLATDPARSGAFLARFYARGLLDLDDPLYSHRLRFANTARCLALLHPDLVGAAAAEPVEDRLIARLPRDVMSESPLARAQHVEVVTFLESYLLHAQGDRMLMANAIEGRFPYLDVRVAELAARLPDELRLRGLREKFALRRTAARHLPPEIAARPKVPYRAPIREAFFGASRGGYVDELLAPSRVLRGGLLDPQRVGRLVAKFARGGPVSETDEMALVGSVSLLLLQERMVDTPTRGLAKQGPERDRMKRLGQHDVGPPRRRRRGPARRPCRRRAARASPPGPPRPPPRTGP
jgi:asparagine synthase (glutamine-hydrolysing)